MDRYASGHVVGSQGKGEAMKKKQICMRCGAGKGFEDAPRKKCDRCGIIVFVSPRYAHYAIPEDVAGHYRMTLVPDGALLVLRSHPEP